MPQTAAGFAPRTFFPPPDKGHCDVNLRSLTGSTRSHIFFLSALVSNHEKTLSRSRHTYTHLDTFSSSFYTSGSRHTRFSGFLSDGWSLAWLLIVGWMEWQSMNSWPIDCWWVMDWRTDRRIDGSVHWWIDGWIDARLCFYIIGSINSTFMTKVLTYVQQPFKAHSQQRNQQITAECMNGRTVFK